MKKLTDYYPFLLLADSFLTIFIKNLPEPFESHYFWVLGWLALLVFNTKVLSSKSLIYVYFLFLVYLIFSLVHRSSASSKGYMLDAINIFIPLSIYSYYRLTKNYKLLSELIKVFFVFVGITAITSIIGFELFPEAVRFNAAFENDAALGLEKAKFFERIGIGNYGFFYGCAFSIPVLVYYVKKGNSHILKLAVLIIILYSIIKSNYTAAFLFAFGGLFFALIGMKKFRNNRSFIILIILVFIIIPSSVYYGFLNTISGVIEEGAVLQDRIIDLAYTINEDYAETHASGRLARIPYLLKQFISSPIWGGGNSTGHVFWLDILSVFGILGIIPFIMLFNYHIKNNLKFFKDDFKYYYLLSMSAFFINGFIKNSGGFHVFFIIFLIIPGMNYIYSKEKVIKQDRNKYQSTISYSNSN